MRDKFANALQAVGVGVAYVATWMVSTPLGLLVTGGLLIAAGWLLEGDD